MTKILELLTRTGAQITQIGPGEIYVTRGGDPCLTVAAFPEYRIAPVTPATLLSVYNRWVESTDIAIVSCAPSTAPTDEYNPLVEHATRIISSNSGYIREDGQPPRVAEFPLKSVVFEVHP